MILEVKQMAKALGHPLEAVFQGLNLARTLVPEVVQRAVEGALLGVGETIALLAVVAFELRPNLLGGDGAKPGSNVASDGEIGEVMEGEDECLVGQFIDDVGHGPAEGHEGVNGVQVPVDQLIERIGVPGLYRGNQGIVGVGGMNGFR